VIPSISGYLYFEMRLNFYLIFMDFKSIIFGIDLFRFNSISNNILSRTRWISAPQFLKKMMVIPDKPYNETFLFLIRDTVFLSVQPYYLNPTKAQN